MSSRNNRPPYNRPVLNRLVYVPRNLGEPPTRSVISREYFVRTLEFLGKCCAILADERQQVYHLECKLYGQKFYFYFKYKIPQGSHIEVCPRQKVS
ncbi:hypothetical protein BI021_gp108 [Salmonella phage NR01]|uniref:Uncharacterized protein n=1 Tax=Salmonella phage NR01 TaxID=1647411 RepID=A0A162EAN6_9CAUD|nr:hypothetical protein BI021_gp108 [Salmonella phage NR01]AKN44447.1 hypothetical protein NR01_0108 [Salmonella phage NR01]